MNVTCRFNLVTQIYYHSSIIWVCPTISLLFLRPWKGCCTTKHPVVIVVLCKVDSLSLLRCYYTDADVDLQFHIHFISFSTLHYYCYNNTGICISVSIYISRHHCRLTPLPQLNWISTIANHTTLHTLRKHYTLLQTQYTKTPIFFST